LELNYPGENERLAMWREFLADVPWSKKDVRVLSDLSEGFSGAEIREICFQLRRKRMMQKITPSLRDVFLSLLHLADSRKDRDRFLTTLIADDGPTIIGKLKERNSKLYSHAELAALIGKSKATTSRWQSKSKLAHA
jgi:SpoVK/Ycf46/Vps4 family AAA+-type ATPase